jgi:hypothetical protein
MRSVAWQCIADRANWLVFYPSVETVGEIPLLRICAVSVETKGIRLAAEFFGGSPGLLFRLRGDQRVVGQRAGDRRPGKPRELGDMRLSGYHITRLKPSLRHHKEKSDRLKEKGIHHATMHRFLQRLSCLAAPLAVKLS